MGQEIRGVPPGGGGGSVGVGFRWVFRGPVVRRVPRKNAMYYGGGGLLQREFHTLHVWSGGDPTLLHKPYPNSTLGFA